MKKNQLIIWLFLLLFITVFTQRAIAEFESVKITDTIFDDLSMNETVDIIIYGNNVSSFQFNVPVGAYDVRVENNLTNTNGTIDIPLNCLRCNVIISYAIEKSTVVEAAGHFGFSKTINFDNPYQLDYTVLLPPGYIVDINNNESEPQIVPKPNFVSTNGKNIIITWSVKNPILPSRYYVSYIKHEPAVDTDIVVNKNEVSMTYFLIGVIGILVGFISGFIVCRLLGKKRLHLPFIPYALLTPDERSIIHVLKKSKEKLSQKEVGRQLNWSKSKVSAIMYNLEYKKIVRRDRFGRNYKIELIKEVNTEDE